MKTLSKKQWLAIGGALVLLLIIIIVPRWYGRFIKYGIEYFGPKLTKTVVSVSSVQLLPFGGKLIVRNFQIGNPPRFQSERALRIKKFSAQVDPKTLLKPVIRIQSFLIDGLEVNYESNKAGNNLKIIQNNVASFAPKSSAEKKSNKKVFIRKAVLKDCELNWHSPVQKKPVHLKLPTITIENLGSETNGITIADATAKILAKIQTIAAEQIAQKAKELTGAGEKELKKGMEKIKGLFK